MNDKRLKYQRYTELIRLEESVDGLSEEIETRGGWGKIIVSGSCRNMALTGGLKCDL